MANVSIKFNGKEFLLSCEDGQEEHLEELLIQINQKFNNLKNIPYLSINNYFLESTENFYFLFDNHSHFQLLSFLFFCLAVGSV